MTYEQAYETAVAKFGPRGNVVVSESRTNYSGRTIDPMRSIGIHVSSDRIDKRSYESVYVVLADTYSSAKTWEDLFVRADIVADALIATAREELATRERIKAARAKAEREAGAVADEATRDDNGQSGNT